MDMSLKKIQQLILAKATNRTTKTKYFSVIADLCEKIVLMEIDIDDLSLCHAVLKKAHSELDVYSVLKTNPKLGIPCSYIMEVFKRMHMYTSPEPKSIDLRYELSLKEYILAQELIRLGYDINLGRYGYDQLLANVNDLTLDTYYLGTIPQINLMSGNNLFVTLLEKKHMKNITNENCISCLNLQDLILIENYLLCIRNKKY
ncbi:hypothetical protein [Lactobacillus delbrueckii]|nr:hypothetical protein [Lactobacillus delbrueckii]MCD5535474.1 hypothetical protein [Lactobacillus delbrueckii subsp. sunkii]